jgi:hypothetical protein
MHVGMWSWLDKTVTVPQGDHVQSHVASSYWPTPVGPLLVPVRVVEMIDLLATVNHR